MNRIIIFFFLLSATFCRASSPKKQDIKFEKTVAAKASDFLFSIGACVHVQHGQDAAKLAPLLNYTGIQNVRDGADKNYDMSGLLLLHRNAGVQVVIGPGSGARDADLPATLKMARQLHDAGALLAIEGPNEPNNFGGVTYQGETSGVSSGTWLPVAKFQRDLYRAVKNDPVLKNYPVFGASEMGAETDNVGLQFLTIPKNAGCLMPDGTKYADFLNVHNYMYHDKMWPGSPHNNQVWNAADPTSNCKIDGLFNNHGITWRNHFKGYEDEELVKLPRVTTETGVRVGSFDGAITEEAQANNYLNLYLAQFKRGWSYTFVYEFLDDPDGAFGFYKADYATPRKSAVYLHNLTTILADEAAKTKPKTLKFAVSNQPETVHNLLLQKHDDTFELVFWGEKLQGADKVEVTFKKTFNTIKIFDPTTGTAPVRTLEKTDVVILTLSDHPMIIELKD